MKKIFALVLAPVVLLLILMSAGPDHAASPTDEQNAARYTDSASRHASKTLHLQGSDTPALNCATDTAPADSLISYAMSLLGSQYVYGGTDASGFDCSGFTSHVYQSFDVPITRSSTTQSEDGVAIDYTEARPGDLLIFTGTNPENREPGHVGIVISEPGDTVSFVHSSSNGGVKVSQVEGSGYEKRLLGVRRVM